MAIPAALGGAVASKLSKDETAGIIKSVMNALERDIVAFHFERDKNTGKQVLQATDVHVTTGLVLGTAFLALLWEMSNWFAAAIAKGLGGDTEGIPNILALVSPPEFETLVLADFVGNEIKDAAGNVKTVQAPSTFGAAFNLMLRNMTVAGPGQAANLFLGAIGNLTTGGGAGGTHSGSGESLWQIISQVKYQPKKIERSQEQGGTYTGGT